MRTRAGLASSAKTGSHAATPPRVADGSRLTSSPGHGHAGRATADGRPQSRNVDVDARDPALLLEHLRSLIDRPLLQRLPYRDDEIGVSLAGSERSGRLILEVAFLGRRTVAAHDFAALLHRLGDSGDGYEVRFRALAR
jgi:hypothetical protein